MAGYVIRGQWKSQSDVFYGETFRQFEAMLPIMTKSVSSGAFDPTALELVTVYLPEALDGKGSPIEGAPDGVVELELPPATIMIRLVPYSILMGDPSKLTRPKLLFVEDIEVENRAVKVLAIPAS